MVNAGRPDPKSGRNIPIPQATMLVNTPNGVQKMLTSLGIMRLLHVLVDRLGGAVEVTAEQIELMFPGQNLYFEYNSLINCFTVSTTPFEDAKDKPEEVNG